MVAEVIKEGKKEGMKVEGMRWGMYKEWERKERRKVGMKEVGKV